ncbi:MAG: 23S rRNA (uracil(1939)-C(5))-methyltransferase RlmD [Syntrophomonadaceae bacterium]|nr:23S rRNA (uracil(1939)-C(5))-methyltransferase RlmD [Syntrophomonadaceae bacterium]
MQCIIEGISHNGEGVARIQGKAVFVPFTLPGEKVTIKIKADKKRYARAELVHIDEPSPDRIKPICPHYYSCGGCAYQHVTYKRQLELKRQTVADNILRIAKIVTDINPVVGMEYPWQYRNKVTWHVGGGPGKKPFLGYYQGGSHTIIPIKQCNLISDKMQQVTDLLQSMLNDLPVTKRTSMVIREARAENQIMLVLYNLEGEIAPNHIKTLSNLVDSIYTVNNNKEKHLLGLKYLSPHIGNTKYMLSPQAFFQVNNEQTEKLINIIKSYANLNDSEQILDAFCGIGSIALNLAPYAAKVTGVESFAPAIRDARMNAEENHQENCQFICGPCETVLPQLDINYDIAILDPPRSGCKPETITSVVKKEPGKIIYVSCNPGTLARDLAVFAEHGYLSSEVQPVDMFPQTYHVETVVLMSKE